MDDIQDGHRDSHRQPEGARHELAYLPVSGLAPASLAGVSRQNGAQQLVTLLAVSNACLRRNLVRLSRLVKHVGHLAYHDELTGLPNRLLLLDRLRQAMRQAARQNKQVLLLLLDLDDFERINERLGRAAGDQVLQQVARRLVSSIRGEDTACRYGGDEFIVMMPEIEGADSARIMARKLRAQLAAPYLVQDQVVTLSASIGSVVYKGEQKDCDDLIEQADIALSLAKTHSTPPTLFARSALSN